MDENIEIFCCYAREDQHLLKQLKTHLVPLQRQGVITVWSDTEISPGTAREEEIKKHLNTAQIILLLISPHFIASDYCYGVEMQYALKRHNSGEARILPIIIRPVIWEQTPFSHLQVLPRDGRPLTRRTNRDEAYLDVARGIESAVKELKKKVKKNFPIFVPPNLKDSEVRPHILIVDDEKNMSELLKLGMRYEGFNCSSVADGEQALNFLQVHQPDLIILDLGLPDIDGVEVCQRLRANPTTRDIPILMSTARDELRDRIIGLEVGADDYLTKPYEFEELVARVRAILRRSGARRSEAVDIKADGPILQFGDLRMNTATREVTRGGRQIELTATEYNLLHLFMNHPREVLDRKTILNRVWGYDYLGESNIIEVHVRSLREKIEDLPSSPRLIQTVRRVGYVLKG